MTLWIVAIALTLALLAILWIARRAPTGYEGADGFHYGEQQDAVDLSEWRPGMTANEAREMIRRAFTDDPREPR